MLRKLTFILIIIASNQVIAFPGEARSYFKDWLVVCQEKAYSSNLAGVCSANTSIRNKKLFPYGDGTIFQLSVQRDAHSDYHIEFYHTLDDSYPSNTVELQIDNHPVESFNISTEGNLARLNSEQSRPLIAKIKAGRWLKIRYISKTGKHINMEVSLRGSSASLLFIDQFYYNRGY